ncbi:restriction endonuclease [Actinospica sp. MGRD01-02]|uniref:Restriction endonuclease n=1 Tax=Actinospica acidithermotolerans TaxID=2828514 RepID=A0A941IMN3_9ACTN|nr:restriction endonuclease [Actinospica acidithermotolerans]MBR7830173.1 restriction endonuclease [Actinospica acidithermotolerans]
MTDDDPRALIAELRVLRAEFAQLVTFRGSASVRGQRFNGFLERVLRVYGIDAVSNQRGLDGRDELDVFFSLGGHTFIVEAKWTSEPIDIDPVAKLHNRLSRRPRGVYGVLISMAGYTSPVLDQARFDPDVFLLQREHVEALVAGVIGPVELFEGLLTHTALRGGGLAPLEQLLRPSRNAEVPRWVAATDEAAPARLPVLEHAVPGAGVKPLITTDIPWFSPWTGMAKVGKKLLLTCPEGIARVDPRDGTGRWEHQIPGCHGPVAGHGQEVLAVRGHGLLALREGAARPVAGPLDRGARLVPGADGAYVFSTTGPPGPVYHGTHLLTRVGEAVGADVELPIDYPGQLRAVAALPDGRLYVAGSSYAWVLEPEEPIRLSEPQQHPAAPLGELGALVALEDSRVLCAGRVQGGTHVEIYLTDPRIGTHTLLVRVTGTNVRALVPSSEPDTYLLLMDVWGSANAPCAMLLEVVLPTRPGP